MRFLEKFPSMLLQSLPPPRTLLQHLSRAPPGEPEAEGARKWRERSQKLTPLNHVGGFCMHEASPAYTHKFMQDFIQLNAYSLY